MERISNAAEQQEQKTRDDSDDGQPVLVDRLATGRQTETDVSRQRAVVFRHQQSAAEG